VTDGAHVDVGLGAFKLFFCHKFSPKSNCRVLVLRLHHAAESRGTAHPGARDRRQIIYLARADTMASATLRGASL